MSLYFVNESGFRKKEIRLYQIGIEQEIWQRGASCSTTESTWWSLTTWCEQFPGWQVRILCDRDSEPESEVPKIANDPRSEKHPIPAKHTITWCQSSYHFRGMSYFCWQRDFSIRFDANFFVMHKDSSK